MDKLKLFTSGDYITQMLCIITSNIRLNGYYVQPVPN